MTSRRGATWNKWDLHVHSPESFEEDFGLSSDLEPGESPEGAVWDRYLDELESLIDIQCVGITDYFSVDGYKRVCREMEDNGRLENLDLILPNIELRVNNFVESRHSGRGDAVEVHVLFSDELAPETIESEFIGQLDATDPHGNEMAIRRESLVELGNDDTFSDFVDDDDPYVRGCKLITVQWEDIKNALNRDRIAGKAMTAVVKRDAWDDTDWSGRAGSQRSQFVVGADAFFVQNEEERQWFLGKGDDLTPEQFEEHFKEPVPAIRGSDTHSFDGFCQPNNDQFCWIKADTTWNGLKQIKYEPEARVSIGPENPQRRVSIYTPDELQISNGRINDRLEIEDTRLPLNANLVTVIGGKGDGKTALLDLLANCFENQHVPEEEVSDDAESFIERVQMNDGAKSVRTHLEFAGADVDSFNKRMLEDERVTRSRIEYLPQGKIADYCRDDDEMHKKVMELVKDSISDDHENVIEDFEEIQNQTKTTVESLEKITNQLQELNPRVIDEQIEAASDELDAAEGKIEDKEEEISEFRQAHKEELRRGAADDLEDRLDSIDERLTITKDIHSRYVQQETNLGDIQEFNEIAKSIESLVHKLELDISPETINYDTLSSNVRENVTRLEEHIDQLERQREELTRELNGRQDANGELSRLRSERRDLKRERDSIHDRLEDLQESKQKATELRRERKNEFYQYLRLYDQLRVKYSDMISYFQEGKSDILEEVEFRAELEVRDHVQSSIYELLDGRSINYEKLTGPINDLSAATSLPDDARQLTEDYIDDLLQYENQLKTESSWAEYEQRVFGDHLKLSERILLNGTPMSQLSLGQKGTVLLKILLAEDDKPLIIDQPEENLDNRFIYDTLRKAFREAKTERQVIIATHNANLVVNTDAEQVIVATYDSNVISFESGPLESSNIRNKVATILEGGRDAFMRREQKYDFNS